MLSARHIMSRLRSDCPESTALGDDVERALDAILREETQISDDLIELSRMMGNSTPIQRRLEKVGRFLGFPFVITDSSYKVIFKTSFGAEDSETWDAVMSKGHFSYESFLGIKRDNILSRITESQGIMLVRADSNTKTPSEASSKGMDVIESPDGYFKHSRIVFKAGSRHDELYVVIIESGGAFAERHYRLAALLKGILDSYFSSEPLDKVAFESSMVHDLICGEVSPESLDELLTLSKWTPEQMKTLVSVRNRRHPDEGIRSMVRFLAECIPNSHATAYEDSVVLIVDHDSSEWIDDRHLRQLEALLSDNDLVAGTSYPYKSLLDSRRALQQASAASALGDAVGGEARIIGYKDVCTKHLGALASSTISLCDFLHPALEALSDYDEANNSEYLATLREYILSGRDARNASKALHIHRNSLDYRLKRIEEIAGCDLADPLETFALFQSFKMDELI